MYTWSQWNDEVKALLPLDRDRMGWEEFVSKQIRQGVLDLQSYIPKYRKPHQDFYSPSQVTPNGTTSKVELPNEIAELFDVYVIRTKTPDDNLTGTTTASGTKDITGVGTKFTEELALGDYIALSSAPSTFVLVTEISSDTALKVATNVGNGTSQTIKRQDRYKYPVHQYDWRHREDLFSGVVCLDQKPLMTISPHEFGSLYVYPPIQSADTEGFAYQLEINWSGKKVDFADADLTPFDEAMADCVADRVKGEIARHVHNDLQAWATFMKPPQGGDVNTGGTYFQKRQRLYLDSKNRMGVAA